MLKYAIAAWLLWASAASAQTSPGLVHGQVPSAAQWNSYFSGKADATSGVLTTPTLTSPIMSGLPTSPLGLPSGTIWNNGDSLAIAP